MPKQKKLKLGIHLDLLRPQSNPEQLLTNLLRWLLSAGRYIFVFVEALVLVVFIARFKLDEDLEAKKEAIENQIPYIESLKSFEVNVREMQLKLSTISSYRKTSTDYPKVLKGITDQVPAGIKMSGIKLDKSANFIDIQLSGISVNSNDLSALIFGLKQNPLFSDINITGIGFDKGSLNFSISAKAYE